MRQSARELFVFYNALLEGVVGYLYCDVRGLVTTSIGVLVDPISLVDGIPFQHPNGSFATKAEIRGAWHVVKARQDLRMHGGGKYAPLTDLRLSPEAIELVAFRKLDDTVAKLRKRFPEWDEWPADAQLAIGGSLAWACGPNFRFPKLDAALRAWDFKTAALECKIANEHGTIKERNKAQKLCLVNAADVMDRGLDRAFCHYPSRVPAETFRAGGGMLAIDGIADGLRH